ncbi:MAG: nucleotidyltransferase [Waddliaceae bacterium]|jgi:nucleotidyltransferase substrate binding protein (TIGR01987 family)|nr:nucleotidyltransferase [Waddliaceae bacterium]MBT3579554.1 nucleotidyltransferase [Waddliaceae bacterium]MBT4444597.1 nucleotidyltransferase [Waddliaceae bacterium]MBT6928763.1 nucleotidyltransferase [Waddliaceae bacterium]MBT7263878.1 nucleotidyltransferase [Waddliaceae bacterium]
MASIRWIQRFNNFGKAYTQLKQAVELSRERPLSELEQQGLIQCFKYTHELAWKTLKDFLENSGNEKIYGSKDATREAFKLGLINDGDIWMSMIKSRNQTSHTYNRDAADEIVAVIIGSYFNEFSAFLDAFSKLKKEQE